MNFKTTFAVLLYVNVFYFGVYSIFELCLLLVKGFTLNDPKYNAATFINEVFILAFMVVVECLRLMFGQQLQPADFDAKLPVVFRVLLLTLPSVYSVAFFTFWQAKVTKLDLGLGIVMLAILGGQSLFIFLELWQRTARQYQYTRIKTKPKDTD